LAGRVRHLRSLGNDHSFWDVANVEAHVRTSLDAALELRGARLSAAQYQRAFAFMWSLCWELSGLEDDGQALRWCWEVRGFYAPRTPSDEITTIYPEGRAPQHPTEARARDALTTLAARRELLFTSVEKVRPRSAYDRTKGLSFSTYSRRMIAKRLTDWYRSDPEFGDNRYDGNRLDREISFEALAEQRRADDGADDTSFLDRRSPGCRLDFVDELNPHAYQEGVEEMLERQTDRRPDLAQEARVANG
jgi:hypothetical protein